MPGFRPLHSLSNLNRSALLAGARRNALPTDLTLRRAAANVDSGVWNHAGHLRVIGVRNQCALCQLALGLGLLRREDVAHLRLSTLDLARASLFEALGRAPVCL
jgi:hypothetical protein